MASAEVGAETSAPVHVEVAYSPVAGTVERWVLTLPQGSTVRHALESSGVLRAHPELIVESLFLGVWGIPCGLDDVLRDRDRVELYRPLVVDPKEARRKRHRSHRAKAAP